MRPFSRSDAACGLNATPALGQITDAVLSSDVRRSESNAAARGDLFLISPAGADPRAVEHVRFAEA